MSIRVVVRRTRSLRAHVQMEERELFPYLERTLEPAELDRIGAMLVPDAG